MPMPIVSYTGAQTQFVGPPAARIRLFADDLTGACDAAVAFLTAGHAVRVWAGVAAVRSTSESVQAFNTNSRSLDPEEADLAVSRAVTGLAATPNSLFFKKIDSAGRGHLASELLAAHRILKTEAILLTPSFPSAGRTVRNGILYVQDAAGQDAQILLADLFPQEIQPLIACIAHPDEIAAARAAGKSILLCDAVSEADLEALAQAASGMPGLLYAGSAGLARAIANLNPAPDSAQPFPHSARTLLVAGTPHPVTALQLDSLAVDNSSAQVLRIRCETGDGVRIRSLFHLFNPQALVLTGGETALLALRALDAHSIILRGEFAPGIPWGILQGGPAHGRVIITKSGGFGSPTTLSDILAALSGKE